MPEYRACRDFRWRSHRAHRPCDRGPLATIETIATHPDHRRGGVATALLEQALPEIPQEVTTVDAWTREDEAANQWYRTRNFEETFRYLHVYASSNGELSSSILSARAGLTPVRAFFHGNIEDEAACREDYGRVYVCRRYVRTITHGPDRRQGA
jgi:ribosomal protein S18 acetylase RimI-like enzyme